MWRETVSPEGFNDGRVGHIVMTRTESLVAKKPDERAWLEWLLAEAVAGRAAAAAPAPASSAEASA